jgi:serine/threonine-protein kinase PknG
VACLLQQRASGAGQLEARCRPDGSIEPLPAAQSIAYAMEMLSTPGYLHAQGLAYCDFKSENVISMTGSSS